MAVISDREHDLFGLLNLADLDSYRLNKGKESDKIAPPIFMFTMV